MTRFHPDELKALSRRTLDHYDRNADDFWEGTRDHDVSQNLDAFLSALGEGRHRILDFGCGPGRDLVAFSHLGHQPVGLDGAPRFVEMARAHAGVPVLCQDFLALELPPEGFDGIFANATLFHVPTQELPRVLGELRRALRPGGILFASNPRGQNDEGWNGERYGAFHDFDAWSRFVVGAGFAPIRHYYRPPDVPREQQRWLASLWCRAESPEAAPGSPGDA